MRPVISDSLISGQPLYLLYSKSNCGAPFLSAPFAAALATQATGSVRLHVTGSPPTTRFLAVAGAQAGNAEAVSVAASAPRSTWRRSTRCCGPGDAGSITTRGCDFSRRTRGGRAPSRSESRLNGAYSPPSISSPYGNIDMTDDGSSSPKARQV